MYRHKSWSRVLAISLLSLVGCATPGPAPTLWKVSEVANFATPNVNLRDNKTHAVIGSVPSSLAKTITEVKDKIESAAGLQGTEFFIASGDQPNAFSADTPSGRIVAINLAMLRMIGSNADEYASILGHEFAHLALHHSSAREGRERARVVASNVLGLALGVVGIPLGGTIANVGTTAVSRTFSRDEEREADSLGIQYMVKAGYDPQGAVKLWQKMTRNTEGGGVPFLATHPSGEERLRTLSEMARTSSNETAH